MKNSTFSAQVANNLLTVLQGYSKTIRLLLVMFVALTVSAEVWADYTIAFKSTDGADGSAAQTTIANLISSGDANVSTISATRAYNGKSGYGIKLGSSGSTGNVNMTLATDAQIKASKLVVKAAYYDSGKTLKVTVTYTDNTTTTQTITPASSPTDYDVLLTDTKTIKQIKIESVTASKGRMYCHSIKVVAASAAVTTYAVTYDLNGGTGTTPTQAPVAAGGTFILAASSGFSNAGYSFAGWNDGTTTYNAGATYTMPAKAVTLKAQWTALPKYTVTLNAGPGTCAASITEKSAGAGVTLPEPTLDCGDWEFAGWAEASVGTETTTKPTLIAAGTYKPASNITLYAVYQRTEGGGGGGEASLTKMVAGNTLSDGDKIVVVANETYTAMYQETINSSYVKKWDCSTLTADVVADDDKNWWTVTMTTGGFHLGDDTNGYLNMSSNNLYCNTNKSVWTLLDLEDGTFKLQSNERNLSYRSDLTTNPYWRMGGASYGTSGQTILNLYKYTSGGNSSTTYYHSTPDCATQMAV